MGRLITPEPNHQATPPGHGQLVVTRKDDSVQTAVFDSREYALKAMLEAIQEPYNKRVLLNYKAKDESYIDSYKFEQRRFPKQRPGILFRIFDGMFGVPIPDETPSRERIGDTVTEDLIRHHHQIACDLFRHIVPKDHPVDKHQYLSTILRPFVGKYIDSNRDFFLETRFTSADVVNHLIDLADTLHLHDKSAAPALAQVERMTAKGTKARPEDLGPPGDSHPCEIHIVNDPNQPNRNEDPADKTSTTPSPG